MKNAEEVFATFARDEYYWYGQVAYPFWDGRSLETFIYIDYDIAHPTCRQLLLLGQLVNYERSIRPEVERALFDHYQRDIYGSVAETGRMDQWEELTPRVNSPGDIWNLLGEPSVRIDYIADHEPDAGARFRLSYVDCPWDREHGFGIQIQDWKIKEFGGEVG